MKHQCYNQTCLITMMYVLLSKELLLLQDQNMYMGGREEVSF